MSAASKYRVAIVQEWIGLGGRFQVVLGFVRALNQIGIVPDILTFQVALDPHNIQQQYGQSLRMNFRVIQAGCPIHVLPDLDVPYFHLRMRPYLREYDLLISGTNAQVFLPEGINLLQYIHFPYEWRMRANMPSMHQPEVRWKGPSVRWGEQFLARAIQRSSRLNPEHRILCNSGYTLAALKEIFPNVPDTARVVYPAVDFQQYVGGSRERKPAVVSLGRFAPDKRQLEHIRLASNLPGMPFYISGFASKQKYLNRCKAYLEAHPTPNAHLLSNLPFDEVTALLKTSRYFLHTAVNEHFGITPVQAVMAGCLPIVHDSGGQRETVPLPELRFSSLDEAPGIIARLEQQGEAQRRSLVRKLQENAIHSFDEPVFLDQVRLAIQEML